MSMLSRCVFRTALVMLACAAPAWAHDPEGPACEAASGAATAHEVETPAPEVAASGEAEPVELNHCPVCGKDSVFKPYGNPPRERVRCPVCGTMERHRLLYFFLEDHPEILASNASVLHFGPNRGLEKRFRERDDLQYYTADLFKKKIDLTLDISDIKLPAETFDVVIAYHILEHVPADRRAMRELYRILKPGGWLIVQVPIYADRPDTDEDPSITDPKERTRRFGQHDHVRVYGWRDFVDRLQEAGFEVTVEQPGLKLDPETIQRMRLVPDEQIYVCRKPGGDDETDRTAAPAADDESGAVAEEAEEAS